MEGLKHKMEQLHFLAVEPEGPDGKLMKGFQFCELLLYNCNAPFLGTSDLTSFALNLVQKIVAPTLEMFMFELEHGGTRLACFCPTVCRKRKKRKKK